MIENFLQNITANSGSEETTSEVKGFKKVEYKSAITTEDEENPYKSYSFGSFNERRELEEKIVSLEEIISNLKKDNEDNFNDFDKQSVQKDIDYKENLDKEKEKSFNKGFEEGKTIGIKKGEDSVMSAATFLKDSGEKLFAEKKKMLTEGESSMVQLAVHVAEKIVNKEVEKDNEIVIQTINKSLSLISDKTDLVVKLSASDLEVVKSRIPDIISLFDDIESLKVSVDDRVKKGGAIIETNSGTIDARLKIQSQEIFDSLMSEVGE